jgi:hypothetical protein
MFVESEFSHDFGTSTFDDNRSGGWTLFPGGITHAELVGRLGLVDFTRPEDGVGKMRLIRTVGKMLGFQAK